LNIRYDRVALSLAVLLAGSPARGEEVFWPDMSSPAAAVGGGEHDAAVVVGV
jgi:hypothetical protein